MPTTTELLAWWRQAFIDACSVYVESDTDCLVSIPVLLPCHVVSEQKYLDYNCFIRLIAQETLALCQKNIYPEMDLRLVVVRHKKDEIQLGDHASILARWHSDRPAFVIEMFDAVHGQSVKLMHFYAATGMPQQHHLQQKLLVRCYKDYRVAAAVVEATHRLLPVTHCTVTAAMEASGDDFKQRVSFHPMQTGEFWNTGMSEDDGLDFGASTTSVSMWSEIGGIVREHCLSDVSQYVWDILCSEIELCEAELEENS